MNGTLAKKIRETLGLSQEELGRQMNVHRRTIIRWEQGAIPISGPAITILNQMKNEAMRSTGLTGQDEPVCVKTKKRRRKEKQS